MSWYVEEGIGEHRAIRLEHGEIIEARLDWPGALTPGQIEDAVLISRTTGSKRGTARFASGEEALVDNLSATASEGSAVKLEVTRASLLEPRRRKLAQARPTDKALRPAPTLTEQLQSESQNVRIVRSFPEGDWDELWAEAWSGEVAFAGGALNIFDTPAMTLIDVDGEGTPTALANAAALAIARALPRFDLGGSIGVDFPTVQTKEERKQIDTVLADTLSEWPHERTAMNGFGFVQVVARLKRVPITRRITSARVGASARRLLRQAERVEEAGAIQLNCHPALKAKFQPIWMQELAKRTGREIRIETDPALALEGGFAQAVPR